MWTVLLFALAVAAEPDPASNADADATLYIDAKLPAEVFVDGRKLAQLFSAGELYAPVSSGPHEIRVYRSGRPEALSIDIPAGGTGRILVGRSGATVALDAAAGPMPPEEVLIPVEFRVTGTTPVQLRVGTTRHQLDVGGRLELDLDAGDHQVSVRNGDGTVIWAQGTLGVAGGAPMVVQLTEGRVPEVSGRGAFRASGG